MDMEALKSDYCAGVLSIQKVADKHGVSKSTLMDWAKKYGWERQKNPSKKSVQNSNGRTDGRGNGRTEKQPKSRANAKDKQNGKSVQTENLSDTKPIRGNRNSPPTNPFPTGNQQALKHGGYGRRLLLSDATIEDAYALTLHDELLWLRASSLTAAENIGRWRVMMDDADSDEARKILTDDISAAEKAMHRNSVRIESIERTLAGMAIDREMPAKIVADKDFRVASTEKVQLEKDKLRKELAGDGEDDDPTPVVVSINVVDARVRPQDGDDSTEP
jgi:uncharacterized protein YjcR